VFHKAHIASAERGKEALERFRLHMTRRAAQRNDGKSIASGGFPPPPPPPPGGDSGGSGSGMHHHGGIYGSQQPNMHSFVLAVEPMASGSGSGGGMDGLAGPGQGQGQGHGHQGFDGFDELMTMDQGWFNGQEFGKDNWLLHY
jgi:hypothetical protein